MSSVGREEQRCFAWEVLLLQDLIDCVVRQCVQLDKGQRVGVVVPPPVLVVLEQLQAQDHVLAHHLAGANDLAEHRREPFRDHVQVGAQLALADDRVALRAHLRLQLQRERDHEALLLVRRARVEEGDTVEPMRVHLKHDSGAQLRAAGVEGLLIELATDNGPRLLEE